MDEQRRQRFKAWLKEKFGEERGWQTRAVTYAANVRHSERPLDKSYLSQVLKGVVAFGEDSAVAMARRFNLPDDYFLKDQSEEVTTPEGITKQAAILARRLSDIRPPALRLELTSELDEYLSYLLLKRGRPSASPPSSQPTAEPSPRRAEAPEKPHASARSRS